MIIELIMVQIGYSLLAISELSMARASTLVSASDNRTHYGSNGLISANDN